MRPHLQSPYLTIDCSCLYREQSSRWLLYRSPEDGNRPHQNKICALRIPRRWTKTGNKAKGRPSCFFKFKLYLCCKCGQLINWPVNSILSRHNKIYQLLKQVYHRIVIRQFNSFHVNNPIRPTFTLRLYLCSSLPDFRLSSWS